MKPEYLKLQRPRHGGDIYTKKIQYDFSVNINPLGMPDTVKQAISSAVLQSAAYPEYENRLLREAIARDMGLHAENVLCGNGASELFAAVVHALKPKKAAIPVPSFYGYEWVAGMEHSDICYLPLQEPENFAVTENLLENLTGETDLLFLANPNNPTGNCISAELLDRIIMHCKNQGIMVVLDESFIEFTGREGAEKLACESENLIVVRTFTKIYAIPGIRLGYLIAQKDLCEKIERQLPEWNISVPAQAAGLALYIKNWGKDFYINKTVEMVKTERKYLTEEIKKMSGGRIKVFPSEANFQLLKTELPLYTQLLKQGILIRDCSNYRGLGNGYYRVAVRSHEENIRLLTAIF